MHDFPDQQRLTVVVKQTIDELDLKGEEPWILEKDGVERIRS